MNISQITLIIRKEFSVLFKNKNVLMGLFIPPIAFSILLPLIVYLIPDLAVELKLITTLIEPYVAITGFTAKQKESYLTLFLLQIFYLILPPLLTNTLASESIVGEKEEGTIESLLTTPFTDGEIFVGKIFSIFVPIALILWLVAIPYMLIVNFFTFSTFHYYIYPNLSFIIFLFILIPILIIESIIAMMIISIKAKTAKEARQLGISFILPLLLIVITSNIFAFFTISLMFVSILINILIIFVLYYLALANFTRERLIN